MSVDITAVTPRKAAAGIENSYQGTGLTEAEIQAKRRQYGFNEIPEKHVGPVMGTLKRMWGPIPWLLEAAMLFELILGKVVQAAVVFLLLVFSAVVGQIQEQRARKAIGYLRRQLQISVRTLRDGRWQTLPSRELVPGDIVHTSFSASTITHGEAIARVSAIGTQSSYGKTAELVRTAEAPGRLQVLFLKSQHLSAGQISSLSAGSWPRCPCGMLGWCWLSRFWPC